MRFGNLMFGLVITPEGGSPVEEFQHLFIEDCVLFNGPEGVDYTIRITNYSGEWVFCLLSIDGLSAVSQIDGSVNNVEGIIVGPYQKIKLDCFIAGSRDKFVFRYSSGAPFGMIGVAFYLVNERKEGIPVEGFVRLDSEWKSGFYYRNKEIAALVTLYFFPVLLADSSLLDYYRSLSLPNPFPADSGKVSGR